ncbi:MAG: hypothetical protein IJ960_09945 [Oscillospiraceae bacterium]|nr:hypothetical protein [Oscillospiraceae bacterium]
MNYIASLRYRQLYTLWGGLFGLTALLGLLFPGAKGIGQALLIVLAVGFFLPPWLILIKARAAGVKKHIILIRCLAAASLAATLALLCAGIRSLALGEGVGQLIHVLTSILCAPLTCGNFYALPIFLWATLLFGSFGKKGR